MDILNKIIDKYLSCDPRDQPTIFLELAYVGYGNN